MSGTSVENREAQRKSLIMTLQSCLRKPLTNCISRNHLERGTTMAECRKNGEQCPDFYKCTTDGDTVVSSRKVLQQYCFYCMATPRIKKIGTIASWTGTTPPWCPRGRG